MPSRKPTLLDQRLARIQDTLARILQNKPAKFAHDFGQAVLRCRRFDRLPKRFREVIEIAETFARRAAAPVCFCVETEFGILSFATQEDAEEFERDNPYVIEPPLPDSGLTAEATGRKRVKKPKPEGKRLPGRPSS